MGAKNLTGERSRDRARQLPAQGHFLASILLGQLGSNCSLTKNCTCRKGRSLECLDSAARQTVRRFDSLILQAAICRGMRSPRPSDWILIMRALLYFLIFGLAGCTEQPKDTADVPSGRRTSLRAAGDGPFSGKWVLSHI